MWAAVASALLAASSLAEHAQAQPDGPHPLGLEFGPGSDLGDGAGIAVGVDRAGGTVDAPSFRWRQVLAAPRIGGGLTSIGIDPTNQRLVIVGSEEGTVIRSDDGGVTWEEIEIDPVVVHRRSLSLVAPGLPRLGESAPTPFYLGFDPPFTFYGHRVIIESPWFVNYDWKPTGLVAFFQPTTPQVDQSLLSNATRWRLGENRPVRRVKFCPGGVYGLFALTDRDLYASMDEGRTWLRVFGYPGRVELYNVECNPNDPKDVVVASAFGLFRSRDGGLGFEPILVGLPGSPATAVGFAPAEAGQTKLWAAWGSNVFTGDPDSDEGLAYVYPDFNNAATAPWRDSRWFDFSQDGSVWMATDDGIRLSPDSGASWVAKDRDLFERAGVWQVVVGPGESGKERIGVLQRYWFYASEDGGRSWHPFAHGLSRRGFRQIAVSSAGAELPGRWWLVTRGEVWSTESRPHGAWAVSRADVRWARDELARMPPMSSVIDRVLDRTELSVRGIESVMSRLRDRNLIPRLDMRFEWTDFRRDRFARQQLFNPSTIDTQLGRNEWYLWLQATWSLRDLPLVSEQLSPVRNELHELRRQVSFVAEDAWNERRLLLQRIADGHTDPVQSTMLRARINAIDAVLEFWMREALGGQSRTQDREET